MTIKNAPKMIRIIWILSGLNTLALLVFVAAYFILNKGRNVDYMERGWTLILALLGLLVIALSAVPLRMSQSTGTQIFAGFFAALPLLLLIVNTLNKKLPLLKGKQSFAKTYYKQKTQRAIATAIEQNDTTLLRQIIKGQDLNIQGTRVWDWDGLNYLQFAIRLRSNPLSFPFDEEANTAAIRILIANGSATTPALAEATQYLSVEKLALLLDAGADPNTKGFVNYDPLIFEVISKKLTDVAILLLKRGANVNAVNADGFTPLMYAAFRAGTSDSCADCWRLVRYLLEELHADITITTKGQSLAGIIRQIRAEAAAKAISMPPDFNKVVEWLKQRYINTEPLVATKQPLSKS